MMRIQSLLSGILFCFVMLLYELSTAESSTDTKQPDNLFSTDFKLRVETSPEEFNAAIGRAKELDPTIEEKLKSGKKFYAWAEFNITDKTCVIYWPYPEFEHPRRIDINSEENQKKLAWSGHELVHCLVGKFHD